MGTLATRLVLLRPRDPESKGIVERRNGWFEKSFMPGRSFASPADFNDQSTDWLATANQRILRTIKARPADLLEADRAGMLALAPVPPIVGWRKQVRLGRDYDVNIARLRASGIARDSWLNSPPRWPTSTSSSTIWTASTTSSRRTSSRPPRRPQPSRPEPGHGTRRGRWPAPRTR